MRTRAERRNFNIKKALRKKRLSDAWLIDNHYYNNLHQYSKNKIHCSCPMCSRKTNNNFYGESKLYKKRDKSQIIKLNQEIKNYNM